MPVARYGMFLNAVASEFQCNPWDLFNWGMYLQIYARGHPLFTYTFFCPKLDPPPPTCMDWDYPPPPQCIHTQFTPPPPNRTTKIM